MGAAGSLSRQLVVSPTGEAAFLTSGATNALPVGPTVGAGAVGGVQVTVSNASHPEQLAGVSVDFGAGAGEGFGGGADVAFGPGGVTQLTATLGGGVGGFGGAAMFQSTSVDRICTQ